MRPDTPPSSDDDRTLVLGEAPTLLRAEGAEAPGPKIERAAAPRAGRPVVGGSTLPSARGVAPGSPGPVSLAGGGDDEWDDATKVFEAPAEQRYQPRGLLGEGGMGEVRLCADTRIGREVAMKVVHPDVASKPGLLARFVREARLQGQLEHPAIVPVYDVGSGGVGGTWFTMKRVRGMTLGDVLDGIAAGDQALASRFGLRRLLGAFVQVANAVGYAHARGVVHRDLKPANVMLGDFGEVYVLDWGLGKVVGQGEAAQGASATPLEAGRTAAGAVMGTPGYMAPEQASGRHDQVDARADVYALGAVLFEILALEPLHPLARPDVAIASTLRGAVARPTARAPSREPPPELDAVCERATALDPAGRFRSATELAAEVERFLDGDRDVALRREMAGEQLDRAESLLAKPRPTPGERASALRALNRAMAVDPSNERARRALAQLLLTPPSDTPAEVDEQLAREADGERKLAARIGAFAYAGWVLLAPLLLIGGVRDVSPWLAGVILVAAAGAACAALAVRKKPLGDLPGALLYVLSGAGVAFGSAYLGPFVLVPGWASQMAIVFSLYAPPGPRRWATIAAGTLPVLVPLALELLGVVSPSIAFEGGKLVLLPRLAELPPAMTIAVLTLGNILMVLVPCVVVAHARDSELEARRRLFAHLWNLRQILPDQAGGAGGQGPAAAARSAAWSRPPPRS